ncbi:hypothetical protein [Bradyrhizobium elkanii]|uniref:hypothetical protein n=1 Tax=Bradyrhizobium elkanii TaxID=29448 RepID=UPI000488C14E|nr:hypothetical protein [Bradyrhizobium elkanii]WLC11874.1 hypothetical protein QIH86_21665 [Bradyrhizobium elkanii USDA 94]
MTDSANSTVRKTAKVTHVSMTEAYTDTYAFEADARKAFEECRKSDVIVFASLHIRDGRVYRLIATYENTDSLDLEMGRFGGA